jgi:DNA-directed RNA polymerase subunit RPC12/RpoP
MKLCLNCYRGWPNDSIICGNCRRSFGGRLCSNKHMSAATASNCTTCGSRKLLAPTKYVSLHVPVTLLSLFILLLAAKITIAFFGEIISLFFLVLSAVFAFLTGHDLRSVAMTALTVVIVSGFVWLLVRRIAGSESAVIAAIEFLAVSFVRTTRGLLALIWRGILQAKRVGQGDDK